MIQDERARAAAYGVGGYVGQEGFMRAGEILALARRAGIARGVSVLDLCCGVAGPGRLITRELGCTYLGVDGSARAVDVARQRAAGLACRFEVARIPPVPSGPFEVVLLLETMLAFPDKETLVREIAASLAGGGRFAFTLEEGPPLTEAEREAMPASDTVWPTPLPEMLGYLERAGLVVRWHADCTASHQAVADALIEAYDGEAAAAHRLWSAWLGTGRVRKLAFVAEKPLSGAATRGGR